MKKNTVKRLSGIVKVGAGVALSAAAITAFIVNNHAPLTNATVVSSVKNDAYRVVEIENSVSESSEYSPSSASSAPNASFPININTATADELQDLSGIGETKAEAIISYRDEHGGFSDITELKNVSGIGEKLFDSIREQITVGDAPSSKPQEISENSAQNLSFPININTASADELQALSGIGKAKAETIISYREEHGGFSDISEIKNVSGIGEKLFDSIREQITVGDTSTPKQQEISENPAQNVSFPININTASADELQALSGIGKAKAEAIISYRDEHGGFSDILEIKNVKGIGEKIFAKISEDIIV